MSERNRTDPAYVMGRSAEETIRLQKQSLLYDPSTRRLFEEAGITTGMKVLDVGSGAGDVALLAADLVGPDGVVVGVDSNPGILEAARERARAAGLENVSFIAEDIRGAGGLDPDFDAVVGRVVLIYLGEPEATLRSLSGHLRPGGIVAFQEIDWTNGPTAVPPSRHLARVWEWVPEMFRRAGLDPQMGLKLHQTFLAAGLPTPTMHLDAPVGGGPDWAGFDYIAGGLRSNLPHILRHEVATEEEVDIDTFAERIRAEVVGHEGVIMLPTFVGAWARLP
ncbi:MAG: class I SAM-dependent methyltransferase [Rubrobacteraceae bacterium]